ncbi:MAG: OadG family protein [Oscillospiraceae bacterium]|jgi:sodium pump decarboxylase gamma subunit|nr:OadG family protein [Oscillospiraceae bacterium]
MNEPSAASLIAQVVLPGLLIVFLGLIILILAVWVMGKLIAGKKTGSAEPAMAAPANAPVQPAGSFAGSGIPAGTVAAIAAAVAAVMEESSPGVPYTITGVRRERESRPAWSLAGAMQNTRPF